MSHYSLLYIGNVSELSAAMLPFTENMDSLPDELKSFNDITEEYKLKYDTEDTQEFYCSSSSSWRQVVSQSFFDKLEVTPIGKTVEISYTKKDLDMMSYFKTGSKYCCGVSINRKCPEKYIWVDVIRVIDTDHPDKDVCFEGTVKLRVINPPRKIPLKEKYRTFEEFMDKYAGHDDVDEKTGKYGYWNNPNSHWDWYEIGGRWAGHITLKPNIKLKNYNGPNFSWGWTDEDKIKRMGKVDSAKKSDIDFERIRFEAEQKAATDYDLVHETLKDTPAHIPWSKFDHRAEDSHEKYHSQPRIEKWKNSGLDEKFGFYGSADDFLIDRETYVKNAGNSAFSTFAVLKDGKWSAKGEMGWFGVVHGETEEDTWNRFFWNMIDELPDDAQLTIVDCHT